MHQLLRACVHGRQPKEREAPCLLGIYVFRHHPPIGTTLPLAPSSHWAWRGISLPLAMVLGNAAHTRQQARIAEAHALRPYSRT